MEWLNIIAARLRGLFRRENVLQDIEDEMQVHIEMETQTNMARGMSKDEARALALKGFGNQSRMAELVYDVRGGGLMETLWQDLRYAARMLQRSPGFTLIALFSLALGIGANTAIFSMIDVMMLKTIPVRNPEQLVLFTVAQNGDPSLSLTYPLVESFQANKNVLTGVVASGGGGRQHMTVVGGGDQSDLVSPDRVTGNFFSLLGVNPVLGRIFTEDDDRKYDAHAVVVISYGLWKRRFGLDPSVIGKGITLDDHPFTIVGVAPPGFTGLELGGNTDIWFPIWMIDQFPETIANRGKSSMFQKDDWWLRVIGRVKPGVTVAAAQSEMNGIFQQTLNEIAQERLGHETASDRNTFLARRIELQSGGAGFSYMRLKFARPLYILMVIVGMVLLIACANVANLLLARAATRQKEIAVRLSLGASRLRLIRQFLTESILLALLGGALGLVLSRVFSGALLAYIAGGRRLDVDLTPNAAVLVFTAVVSVVTGVLFGLAPALSATGFDVVQALKDTGGHLRLGTGRISIDKALMVIQVSLSLFLLIGAGLFVRSLQKLKSVDTGFDPQNVLTFSLDLKPSYKSDQRMGLERQLLARLASLPGSRSASITGFTPLSSNSSTTNISIPGYTPGPDDNMVCHIIDAGPRYFETMGVPVLMGRDFNERDDINVSGVSGAPVAPGSIQGAQRDPKPAVINQTMADFFWKNENPLGKRFSSSGGWEVVGVVKDSKYVSLKEKVDRTFYRPYFMGRSRGSTFLLRTFNNPTVATATIQQAVRNLDKDARVLSSTTMEEIVDASLLQERFITQLVSFFSLFALLLACMGLYGITSYGVVRRTREMGIRMALGARPGGVVWLMMRQSLLLVGVGVVIAIPAALATTRFVASYLFDLSPADPVTIVLSTLVLLVVAGLAGYLPARRASSIDPMEALRYE